MAVLRDGVGEDKVREEVGVGVVAARVGVGEALVGADDPDADTLGLADAEGAVSPSEAQPAKDSATAKPMPVMLRRFTPQR